MLQRINVLLLVVAALMLLVCGVLAESPGMLLFALVLVVLAAVAWMQVPRPAPRQVDNSDLTKLHRRHMQG
jgi:hypothetical protein